MSRQPIEVIRLWIDGTGQPRREVAQMIRVGPTNPRGRLFDMTRIEGTTSTPLPPGKMRIVAVADAAADPAALRPDPNVLYDLPLAPGARLVDQPAWDQAATDRAAIDAAQAAAVRTQLDARAAAQAVADRDALTAGLGVTDAQIATAVAAYMALNPPGGPSTQQIAAAVAAHLQAYPPPPGRAPTQEELLAAVSLYVAANADQLRGPQGVPGAAGAQGAPGPPGAQGPAGTPADPAAVALLQAQLTLLMASYNAGMEVRVEQVPVPLLALGATATRTITWSPAFTTGRTVTADAFSDALVGKATVEIVGTPTVTSVEVKITAAVVVTATTGFVVGISRRPA